MAYCGCGASCSRRNLQAGAISFGSRRGKEGTAPQDQSHSSGGTTGRQSWGKNQ